MALTYRTIGARAQTQGGFVFNNLAITNQLSTRPPLITSGNLPLVEIVANAIESSTTLIQSILPSLENTIFTQVVGYKNLADFVTSTISTLLSTDDTSGGFLEQLYNLLLSGFTPTAPTLFSNSVTFMNQISELLVPFAENIIFNANLDFYIISDLITNLSLNTSLLQTVAQNLASSLFENTKINNSITDQMETIPLTLTLVNIPDRVRTTLTTVFISPNDTRKIRFNTSTFSNSPYALAISRLTFTLNDAINDSVVYTFYDTIFSPTVFEVQTTESETTISNNTIEAKFYYIKVYVQFSEPFYTLSGVSNFVVTRDNLNETHEFNTLFTSPKIFLGLIQNNGCYVYDSFDKRVQQLLMPKNGMIQFTNGYPLWNFSLPNMLTSFICQGTDYSIYVTGNVNGTITLNSTVPIVNPYTSGDLVVLIKFNSAGIAQWICNIKSLGLSNHSVHGIVSDINDNIFIYGTHNGSALYAYNYDDNNVGTVIDTGPYGMDKNHAFVAKYSLDGVLTGYLNISNSDTPVSISSLYVDPNTNGLCIAGNAKSFTPTYIRNFNNQTLSIHAKADEVLTKPIGYGFSVYLNHESYLIDELGTYSVVYKSTNTLTYDFLGNVYSKKIYSALSDSYHYLYILNKITYDNSTDTYRYGNIGLRSFPIDPGFSFSNVIFGTGRLLFHFFDLDTVSNSTSFVTSFSSPFFIDDGFQQMSAYSTSFIDRNSYVMLRSSGPININTLSSTTTLNLVQNETDINFLIHLDRFGYYLRCVQISNAYVSNMVIMENSIYVNFVFYKRCTVYNSAGSPAFSVGESNKTGSMVVQFSTGNITPVLVGYYLSIT